MSKTFPGSTSPAGDDSEVASKKLDLEDSAWKFHTKATSKKAPAEKLPSKLLRSPSLTFSNQQVCH